MLKQTDLGTGAPGRTRTSTMLPLPDFESGASTNSATGAGGRNIAAKYWGSTGVPRASRHALPSLRDGPLAQPLGPGSRWRSPGTRNNAALYRGARPFTA